VKEWQDGICGKVKGPEPQYGKDVGSINYERILGDGKYGGHRVNGEHNV
jgi:hypothetical protein